MEERGELGEYQGKHSAAVGVFLAGVAEGIVLLAVAMQVQEHLKRVLLRQVQYAVFERPYLRVKDAIWKPPLPIEIEPTNVAAEVAVYHSVHIHHRHYLKYELVSQVLGCWAVPD